VFSIGVIFYILLCGEAPFNGKSAKDILDNILKGDFTMDGPIWSHISPQAKNLIKEMLCRQDDRLTAEEAVCHPYFDEIMRDAEEGISRQVVQNVGRALTNLRTFNSSNKMRQSCLGYLVQHFTSV
jgi:calcium-dependent protein kinase